MSDPSDLQGADYTGGDVPLNVAPTITTAVQNFTGNTYSGQFQFIFQLQANPGSPDTALTWSLVSGPGSINASNGVYSYSLVQGQTASGQVILKVSNNNGEATQTWSYNIVNTQPPFFTSPAPAPLIGDISYDFFYKEYNFTANRGAPNTSSPIVWSVSPQTYLHQIVDISDTAKTIAFKWPQGTPVSGQINISISNANGSASQTLNYDMRINSTPSSNESTNYWALDSSTNSLYNTNSSGNVNVTGNLSASGYIRRGNIIMASNVLGFITGEMTQGSVGGSSSIYPTAYFNEPNKTIIFNKIIDQDSLIDWLFIKNAPKFASVSSDNAGTVLGALGTALAGVLAAGIGLASLNNSLGNWIRQQFQYDTAPTSRTQTNDDGNPVERNYRLEWPQITEKPFLATYNRFAIETDTYLSDTKSLYLLSAGKYKENADYNTYVENVSGAYKVIDGPTKSVYADRFIAGAWELRVDGLYYEGRNVLNQTSPVSQEGRSSVRLTRIQDGQASGETSASANRFTSFMRRGQTAFTNIFNETFQPNS